MSRKNYIVISPNNDVGNEVIFNELKRVKGDKNFKIFPSVRFEYYLTLFKNADFIIGNSSSGVRVAEIYKVPSIDIGTRQKNRSINQQTIYVPEEYNQLMSAIEKVSIIKKIRQVKRFGDGKSAEKFMNIIRKKEFWETGCQKQFKGRGE